ncbi:MAG: hypothetical protein Greene071421_569 [Parcubacteria group bacterium Greene0714_21]|nr:MAG: hypothetical protein Greene071421_569 [Parcubacteria group bacterium Greene0714_21]
MPTIMVGILVFGERDDCRAEATPMLELRLSSQLSLTLRPFSSKLPTLTRLPFESTCCQLPPLSLELEGYCPKKGAHILLFLYFIPEQPRQNRTSPLKAGKKFNL